ncbi:MAG: purine-cytosine permease family protein, partial [Candidatus Dormibacteraceae bacterium]
MDSTADRRADAVFQIERRGIEAVPDTERHGRPKGLAFLWAGAFCDFASILTASLLSSVYGLGLWDAFAALLIGTLVGALGLGLLSQIGVRTGLPQVPFAERVFGHAWMRVAAALTLVIAIGWFAVDTVIAAQAGVQLITAFGAPALAARLAFPFVLIVAAISVAVAVLGHDAIQFFERWGVLCFAAFGAIVFVTLIPQMRWSYPGAGHPGWGALVLGAMACFALVASWYPFTSDYSRYLPSDSRGWSIALWPVVGIALTFGAFGLFGLLLVGIDPALAESSGGVLAVITHHAPGWVAVPFLAYVLCGEVWSNYLDVYTAGLCLQAVGIRLERWQTALLCGIAGALLATYAVVVQDFTTAYQEFLLLTYLWMPAWAVILLLGWRAGPTRRRAPAIVSWILATAVSVLFVNYPNVFPSLTHVFNQGLIGALDGADLSGV